jgi:hypothetical protein
MSYTYIVSSISVSDGQNGVEVRHLRVSGDFFGGYPEISGYPDNPVIRVLIWYPDIRISV